MLNFLKQKYFSMYSILHLLFNMFIACNVNSFALYVYFFFNKL